jgi:hypothetical protein
MKKFNQRCSTIRTLNNKLRKDTQMKFYKVTMVPKLIYKSKIWTTTKKQEAKIETAEMNFLRSVAGYTRKDKKNILKLGKK